MLGDALRVLGRYAAQLDAATLPGLLVDKAKACLLYGLAVGAAGMRATQPAQAARASPPGDGSRHPLLRRRAIAMPRRRLRNGTLFHARVQDDAHPAGHVGVVVMPAALAMAEAVERERTRPRSPRWSPATRPRCASAATTRPT